MFPIAIIIVTNSSCPHRHRCCSRSHINLFWGVFCMHNNHCRDNCLHLEDFILVQIQHFFQEKYGKLDTAVKLTLATLEVGLWLADARSEWQ